MMNDLSILDIDTLLPAKWKNYGSWLSPQHNPPKSYKEHPFTSEEELIACKKDFQKYVGISLGKYIRLKRVNYLLQQKDPKFQTNFIIDYINTEIGKMLEKELISLQKKFKANFVWQVTNYSKQLQAELDEYFQGKRKIFNMALNPVGTEFQRNVWDMLLKIPYGKTSSYKQQAESIGNLNAIRAVASANGYNKISILIPCHRVIGSDGSLVGYGGGVERKCFLLELEKSSM